LPFPLLSETIPFLPKKLTGKIPTSPVQRSAALDRGIYFPKEQFPNKKAERFGAISGELGKAESH